MIRYVISLLIILIAGNAVAQDIVVFHNLDSALKDNSGKKIKLDLSNKNLTTMPKDVFKVRNLCALDVSGNRITEIPSEIKGLKELVTLSADSNVLVSKNVFVMRSLKGLDLIGQTKGVSKPIAELTVAETAVYLKSINDLDAFTEFSAANDIQLRMATEVFVPPAGLKPWQHSSHAFGFISSSEPKKIVGATTIQPDNALKNKRIKISLDLLYAHT